VSRARMLLTFQVVIFMPQVFGSARRRARS
jgi:hypothetical protein